MFIGSHHHVYASIHRIASRQFVHETNGFCTVIHKHESRTREAIGARNAKCWHGIYAQL
jgi:hypothetical protein